MLLFAQIYFGIGIVSGLMTLFTLYSRESLDNMKRDYGFEEPTDIEKALTVLISVLLWPSILISVLKGD